jgi:shikimate dehydrogenase
VVKESGLLAGYNTDIYGFCKPLHDYEWEIGGRAVVFGTGGAARAIAGGLQSLGMEEVILVSRNPQTFAPQNWPGLCRTVSYDAWPSFAEETVLMVNATPLGMEPNIGGSPVKDA